MTAWLKDVIGYGLHAARPAAGSAGALYYETDTDTLLRDNGTTWDALTLGSASPLTTKGDVFVHGSSDARLPVGTDGQVLTADSTQTLGVKWATAGSGAGDVVKIATVVVGSGGAATISFSAIPDTHRHLELILDGRSDGAGATQDCHLQFNGDTAANYDTADMYYSTGTNAQGDMSGGVSSINLGVLPASTATANHSLGVLCRIPNYAGTTFFKNIVAAGFSSWLDSTGGVQPRVYGGVWRSTAAITSVLLSPASGNFLQGSVATLYGRN